MIDDPYKNALKANNIKNNGLNFAIEQAKDRGATLSMGVASLFSYKMVQNNTFSCKKQGDVSINADKISTNFPTSSKNNFLDENTIDSVYSNGNNYTFSALHIEQLQLDYYLQIVMMYLLILVSIFLIMKDISDKRYKF